MVVKSFCSSMGGWYSSEEGERAYLTILENVFLFWKVLLISVSGMSNIFLVRRVIWATNTFSTKDSYFPAESKIYVEILCLPSLTTYMKVTKYPLSWSSRESSRSRLNDRSLCKSSIAPAMKSLIYSSLFLVWFLIFSARCITKQVIGSSLIWAMIWKGADTSLLSPDIFFTSSGAFNNLWRRAYFL